MTYTLGWGFSATSPAPGRRASFGSNGSLAPEDYPEAGSMWEHLAHFGVPFRNYGEGFEFAGACGEAGVLEDQGEWETGAREVINMPMSRVLFDNTCRDFPIFNMNIPDQYRADWFAQEVQDLFLSGKRPLPRFLNVALCNDHGTAPDAAQGYPYVASWMADNDLALGRIVEAISRSRFWAKSLILVVEDDAQDGLDHVDGHRTVALAIGPYIRRKAVDSNHYNFSSMLRTIQEIFQIPPRTRFLKSARAMTSIFTAQAEVAPYQCLPAKVALDEMNPPLKALNGRKLWAARQSLAMNWSEPDDIPQAVLNRILWWDSKGYDRPYPKGR